MFTRTGYASASAESSFSPFTFQRRDPGPSGIEILPRGVCHSDLHAARDGSSTTSTPVSGS